ncbi:protein of unknown function [Rhodovastum atsumiense]|nr:protein of unknown function [Rhodovastum atsumiense]
MSVGEDFAAVVLLVQQFIDNCYVFALVLAFSFVALAWNGNERHAGGGVAKPRAWGGPRREHRSDVDFLMMQCLLEIL